MALAGFNVCAFAVPYIKSAKLNPSILCSILKILLTLEAVFAKDVTNKDFENPEKKFVKWKKSERRGLINVIRPRLRSGIEMVCGG